MRYTHGPIVLITSWEDPMPEKPKDLPPKADPRGGVKNIGSVVKSVVKPVAP